MRELNFGNLNLIRKVFREPTSDKDRQVLVLVGTQQQFEELELIL